MAGRSALPIRYFRKWMYDTPLLEANFSLGIVRDLPRSLIPPGGVYDSPDFLVDQPGKLYKRGGSSFASDSVSGHGQTLIVAIAAAEFPGDPRLIMIGTDGAATRTLYDITSGTAATGVVVNRQPFENPPTYLNKLILTDGAPTSTSLTPKKAYVSATVVTVADLGGSPPQARYSCVHLGFLVLGNNDANRNRIWFSPRPDIEGTWDTGKAYIDVAGEISGLASVGGVLLIFTRAGVQRVVGSIPPGFVGEDMSLQPLGGVGCIDARSIVHVGDLIYFAHESGIYYTNGSSIQSITTKPDGSGISSLWRSYTSDLDPVLGAVVASGVFSNDWMLTTIRHPSGPDVQFLCYLPTGAFTRTSTNIASVMYASREAPHAELYAANASTSEPVRAMSLKGLFTPTATNKNDADGTAVTPTLEPRMIGNGPGLKSYGDGFITFDMRDSAADNPALAVQVAKGLEATTYVAVAESPLAKTTDATRRRFTVSKDAQAINLKFIQANASSKTEIYAIEASERPFWVADGQ